MMTEPTFSVSDAIAVLNQTLEMVYPSMTVVGELSNFKVAKEKWVYADLKDDSAKMRLFGTVFQLPGPLEDGMMLEIVGEPRLHPQFGFSFQVRSMRPIGEGTIQKAADLLHKKLQAEGLFAAERKRPIPYPPAHIGLVTSETSAAYADFMKIVQARWPYMQIDLYNAAVQGQDAVNELVGGIEFLNKTAMPPEVIVVIRGGGSKDDLSAFSSEQVTRAIAASRTPTIVAIGHEIDESLAELAADMRASTPSNAAELLVPNEVEIRSFLKDQKMFLTRVIHEQLAQQKAELTATTRNLSDLSKHYLSSEHQYVQHQSMRLESYNPKQVLHRGYALVRKEGKLIRAQSIQPGDTLEIELESKTIQSSVISSKSKE